jgi:hypothetical protein
VSARKTDQFVDALPRRRNRRKRRRSNREVILTGPEKRALRDRLFRSVNLDGVDLTHADLRNARFECVSMRGADLSGADLRGAAFHGCDLRTARLATVSFGGNCFVGSWFVGAKGMTEAQRGYVRACGGRFIAVLDDAVPSPGASGKASSKPNSPGGSRSRKL